MTPPQPAEKRERAEAASMLREFHSEADHPDTNALWLRPTLHREEHDELIEALHGIASKALARTHPNNQTLEPDANGQHPERSE